LINTFLKNFSIIFSTLLSFISLIFIWQLLSVLQVFEPWLLPSPLAILSELFDSKQFLFHHMLITAFEIFIGLFFAIFLGSVFGFSMALSKILERSFLPYLIASQVIPIFALAPILIVWFGAGLLSKIIVVFLISFFPICIGVFDGLRHNNNDMENLLKTQLVQS
jgi:putative hydroxymethylpyrimidine transport system permease protein